jgi:hypothetical protein
MTTRVCEPPGPDVPREDQRGISAQLMIVDISGYTGSLLTNSKATAHGHAIINQLMTILVAETHAPIGNRQT